MKLYFLSPHKKYKTDSLHELRNKKCMYLRCIMLYLAQRINTKWSGDILNILVLNLMTGTYFEWLEFILKKLFIISANLGVDFVILMIFLFYLIKIPLFLLFCLLLILLTHTFRLLMKHPFHNILISKDGSVSSAS